MASTTSSICFSIPLIWRSTAEAMVGEAGGGCCAGGALAAAIRANVRSPRNKKTRIRFIDVSFLVLAIMAFHGIQQLLRVVPDAVLEDDFYVFDVRDSRGRIALHHHEVRVLTG